LREPRGTERVAHGALVREEVSRFRADPRESELLRDGGDDRHRAIGRDGECAVDADAPGDLHDLGDIREIDDLGDVGGGQPGRLSVPIDRGHAKSFTARLLDCATLVAPGADEEHGLHGRRW